MIMAGVKNMEYVDNFIAKSSSIILRELFITKHGTSKEISESYAPYRHIKTLLGRERMNSYDFLHIGDGSKARTASLFAFLTHSFNHSVDPILNIPFLSDWMRKYDVKNLNLVKQRFEHTSLHDFKHFGNHYDPRYGIVCVHSHVALTQVHKMYPDWGILYSNTCCFENTQTFTDEFMEKHNIVKVVDMYDPSILSPDNRVVIYIRGV